MKVETTYIMVSLVKNAFVYLYVYHTVTGEMCVSEEASAEVEDQAVCAVPDTSVSPDRTPYKKCGF